MNLNEDLKKSSNQNNHCCDRNSFPCERIPFRD